MSTIINPIIKGFNPDPSIIRVKDDYYIATSTFEWYPGVQIHHSKDLTNWTLLTRPLRRDSQLNMLGEMSSAGIWAPCLTHCDGIFYLVYTDVKENGSSHNYLVTTKDIEGDWSEPIYLHTRGFDPSMFHDEDGKKWVVVSQTDPIAWNLITNFKTGIGHKIKNASKLIRQYKKRDLGSPMFRGIQLQEYDGKQKKMVGPCHKIFDGTKLGKTEGAHLYKRNGYYYLLTAEGGTGYAHAVTLARSKNIDGPYEVHPNNPILTSHKKDCVLQRAGHADLVDTPEGHTYMVHLCSRPLKQKGKGRGRSVLGRETAIQKMKWDKDDWLRMSSGSNTPEVEVEGPYESSSNTREIQIRDHFDSPVLGIDYQWLRAAYINDLISLTERPGYLRIHGNEMILSNYKQGLVARRQQSFDYRAQTCLDFDPKERNQDAGLIVMYNVDLFYYLYIAMDNKGRKFISVMFNDKGKLNQYEVNEISVTSDCPIHLRANVSGETLIFSYSYDEVKWKSIDKIFDITKLCDERVINGGGFTGNFVGICCHDPITLETHADFDYFDYEEM